MSCHVLYEMSSASAMPKMVGSVPASGVGGSSSSGGSGGSDGSGSGSALSCQNEGTNDNDKNETQMQQGMWGEEEENVDRASFGLANCRCCHSLTSSCSRSSSCSSYASLIVGFWRRLVSRRLAGICIRLTRAQVQPLPDCAQPAAAAGELTRPSRISLICVGGVIRGAGPGPGRGRGRGRRHTLCNQKHLTPKRECTARQSAIVKDEPNTLAQMPLQACITPYHRLLHPIPNYKWKIEATVAALDCTQKRKYFHVRLKMEYFTFLSLTSSPILGIIYIQDQYEQQR